MDRGGYGCSHHGLQSAVWPAWSKEHVSISSVAHLTQHSNYDFLEKVQQTHETFLFSIYVAPSLTVSYCVLSTYLVCTFCFQDLRMCCGDWPLLRRKRLLQGLVSRVKLTKICFFRSLACVMVPNTILMGYISVCRKRKGTSRPHTDIL